MKAIADTLPIEDSPHGWHPPERYAAVFGEASGATRALRLRWIQGLPEEQRCQRDGVWWVRGDVVLPNGKRLDEWARHAAPSPIPEAIQEAGESSRQRELAGRQVYAMDRQFQEQHSNLAATTPQYFAELQRVYGARIKALGFSPKRTAMLRLRRRVEAGEPADGRVRSGRRRSELFDAGLFDECCALATHENKFALTGVNSVYEYGLAKAKAEGRLWDGSPRTFVDRLREAVPAPIMKRGREGAWKFEAESIPKLTRDPSRYAAGECVSLDGRRLDRFVAIGKRGVLRAARPMVVVFFDYRSSKGLAAIACEHETSAATIAAFCKMCGQETMPARIEPDHGKAFKWLDDERLGLMSVCEYFGIEVGRPLPRAAWGKPAESYFKRMKELDRQDAYFCGGSPTEKPEGVAKRAALHVHELVRLDELQAVIDDELATYNATPKESLGGLSPNIVYEQNLAEVRRAPADVLSFLCSRVVGWRTVRRDGVEWRGVRYGAFDESVWSLQGQRVLVRFDPADASAVWLCDKAGKPLALATQSRLTGATGEDLKKAEKKRGHLRKVAREYMKGREYMLDGRVAQVRQVMREHRQAVEAEQRKSLPEPEAPDIRIAAGTDLTEPIERAKQARARRAAPAGNAKDGGPASGFARLAARAEEEERAERAQVDEQTRGDAFARLFGETREAAG